ncbi:hypothetical protein [Burkholderia ubonensis]|uniref:hypothetical protein n=1 Tax=Burkholderia ubonensis TaxID=101571 RepID=UPI000AFA8998|nr:hypothetical protein [Burkholderia ubonensis]
MGSVHDTHHVAHRTCDAATTAVRDGTDVFAKGRQGREYPVFLFANLFVMMT